MPTGTLDVLKLGGNPASYQIMFEQNAGGTYVARVEPEELVPFLHEEIDHCRTSEGIGIGAGMTDKIANAYGKPDAEMKVVAPVAGRHTSRNRGPYARL